MPRTIPVEAVVFVGCSLDGFIARHNGSLDFLEPATPPEAEGSTGGDDTRPSAVPDFGFYNFVAACDAIVMGRKTFDVAKSSLDGGDVDMWPYKGKPVYVLSRTLTALPPPFCDPSFPHIVMLFNGPLNGDVKHLVSQITSEVSPRATEASSGEDTSTDTKAAPSTEAPPPQPLRIYVDGGTVMAQFAKLGMIKEYVITTVPVLIGSGVRLFPSVEEDNGASGKDVKLQLVKSECFFDFFGVVKNTYRVA